MRVANSEIYRATSLPKSICDDPKPWEHCIIRRNDDKYQAILFVWDTRQITRVIQLPLIWPYTKFWMSARDNRKDIVDSQNLLEKSKDEAKMFYAVKYTASDETGGDVLKALSARTPDKAKSEVAKEYANSGNRSNYTIYMSYEPFAKELSDPYLIALSTTKNAGQL